MRSKLYIAIVFLALLLINCSCSAVNSNYSEVINGYEIMKLCDEADVVFIGVVKYSEAINCVSKAKASYRLCLYKPEKILKGGYDHYDLSREIPVYNLVSSEDMSCYNNSHDRFNVGKKLVVFAKSGMSGIVLGNKSDAPKYLCTFDAKNGVTGYSKELENAIFDILQRSGMLSDAYKNYDRTIEYKITRDVLESVCNAYQFVFIGKVKFVGQPPIHDSGMGRPVYQLCIYEIERILKGNNNNYLINEIPIYHLRADDEIDSLPGDNRVLDPDTFNVGERLIIFADVETTEYIAGKEKNTGSNRVNYLITTRSVINHSRKIEDIIIDVITDGKTPNEPAKDKPVDGK